MFPLFHDFPSEFLYNMPIAHFLCLELAIFNAESFCLNFMESHFIFGSWGPSFIGLLIQLRIKVHKYVKDVIPSRDTKAFHNNCATTVIIQ